MSRITRTHLSALAAAMTVALVAAAVWPKGRPSARRGVVLERDTIHIRGEGITLQDVAEAVNDRKVFVYDVAARTATARASLVIRGSLLIGREGDPAFQETLEVDSILCGQRRIVVEESGEIRMYNSTLSTRNRTVTDEMCTQGYTLNCRGRAVIENSRVTYMSGSYSRTFWPTSEARLLNSSFTRTDGNAASFYEPNGARLHIDNCTFATEGSWGIVARGRGATPLRIVSSSFSGTSGDVLNAGNGAEIHLVDCKFRKDKIHFSQLSGSVAVKWRLTVQVIDERSGRPATGVTVRATSSATSAIKERAEGRTDANGTCVLEITEYVARPSAKASPRGRGGATPHDVTAIDSTTGAVLAQENGCEIREPGQTVILRVRE